MTKPTRCAVAAAAVLAAVPWPAAAQDATIAGTWTLNRDLSDDPCEMMQQMRPRGPRGGPQPDGGPRGGMRGPGRGGDREQMRRRMDFIMGGADRITLAYDDTSATLTYGDRPPLVLRTDWKKQKRALDDMGDVELKARWDTGELVLERKLEDTKVTEWYKRSPEGTQLFVITRVESRRLAEPLMFRRVYERR